MRSSALSHNRGFTLLELVVAMTCSAILVALLVTVWIQMMRVSVTVMGETAVLRERETERRGLQRLLQGARWSATSLAPGGALPWQTAPGRLVIWNSESGGQSAGPVQWTLESRPEGLAVQILDPLGPGPTAPAWPQVQSLRLEVLASSLETQGEELKWVDPSQWQIARPFRPVAIRLWVRWRGQEIEECLMKTL